MWPSSDEYYSSIQSARYRPYREEERCLKRYIELDVGFYGGCSYHPEAWEETFRSIRTNFPSAPIILFEDGRPCGYDYTDMASRYACTYIRKDKSIYLFWPTPEQCWEYLQWILEAADTCKTEWLVQLHPDNICNDRFMTVPPGPLCGVGAGSHTGSSYNRLPESAVRYILARHPTLEMNGYGWVGGGCIHVPTFRKIMETFTYDKLLEILKEVDQKVAAHEDLFLPFLFNIHGYPYRVWLDIEEPQREYNGLGFSAAFQHGNKTYYKINPSELEKKIMKEVNESFGTEYYYNKS